MPSNDTHTATTIIRYLMLLGAAKLAVFMYINEFVDSPGDAPILTSNLWLALDFFLLVVLLLGFFRLGRGRK